MKRLSLLTAAGAALMMIGGTALAQSPSPSPNANPSSTGASKSHMGNPDPAKGKDTKKNKSSKEPATRNGELPKGGKNRSGGM